MGTQHGKQHTKSQGKPQGNHDGKHGGKRKGPSLFQLVMLALVVAAVTKELQKDKEDRTWHGTVAGFVPYEFRVPTVERFRERVWDPEGEHLLSPHVFARLAGEFGLHAATGDRVIDHLLVNGLEIAEPPRQWAPARRQVPDPTVGADRNPLPIRLSDHAPVEALFATASAQAASP